MFCIKDYTKCIICSNLDINECNDPNTCYGNGMCVNSQGSFKCICKDGFQGKNCESLRFEQSMYKYLSL